MKEADVKRHPWNQSFDWKIPPRPYRALTDEQAEQFDSEGFVVLPDVSAGEVSDQAAWR